MHSHLRRFGALAVSGALLVTLAACSGSSGGSSSSNDIEIWYRPGSLPTASINGVQAQFPQANIKLVKTPDVDTKLQSALRTNSGIPDIAVANIFVLASASDKFANVDDYGFKDVADQYLGWKVTAAQDSTGRQIGIPIDIGPEGFFYRADKFAAAGLPTDPAQVSALVSTWDGYEATAKKLTDATGSFACDSAGASIYTPAVFAQGYYYYVDKQPAPADPINKDAFTKAIAAGENGLCLNAEPYSTDWSAGIAQGTMAGFVGPAYEAALIPPAGGDGSGQWRVANAPGGPSAQQGSNISVFKASKNPTLATQIAEWMTNPTNQAAGYSADGLFPSTPSSYTMSQMQTPDPFYGGQVTSTLFASVAQAAPTVFQGPSSTVMQSAFSTALTDGITNKQSADDAFAAGLAKATAQ
ncbi:ABC transporter substrate-binding protein [Subtercola endophyticus]|uniref:ABC transporter substrate-binding protein n=1 Tax=Subtercola endophyticus TaxID=2895559 RepID=UPI001E5C4B4E|nr:extracellular solute-binding protein [Subtercola endophyticus]UFS58731.1 extracellular solute-binding protein [Subtercola endophyticus]